MEERSYANIKQPQWMAGGEGISRCIEFELQSALGNLDVMQNLYNCQNRKKNISAVLNYIYNTLHNCQQTFNY